MSDTRPRVVAVGGPTAAGKSALAIALAQEFGGEIVSADSMQIYRGLDIGTAKPTPQQRAAVPHRLVDILAPEQPYSVADFTADAAREIADITARGALPVVTGGTGLYLTSLLDGVRFAPEKTDPAVRARLQAEAAAQGTEGLYERLCALDPETAARLHPNDAVRIIRALELQQATGRRMSDQQRASRPERPPYRALLLCLTCRDRAALYAKINARVEQMLADGLLDEARRVWQNRGAYKTAAQAIGYKEFFPYFEGTAPLGDCAAALKQATRRYAKRQLTWFRRRADAVWLYADEEDARARAAALVRQFLQD